jgi:hypothetical protein
MATKIQTRSLPGLIIAPVKTNAGGRHPLPPPKPTRRRTWRAP